MSKITEDIKDLVFPRRCAICDEVLPHGMKYICKDCSTKVVYIKEPYCLKCGKALVEDKEYCEDCLKRPHYFRQGVSVFDYGSVSDSLYRFKNMGRVEYAEYYAKVLYEEKGDWLKAVNPDCLIPVPIHSSKLKKRGYNQAELISKELSRLSGIPTDTSLLLRAKKTNPLKELSLKERQNNLKKAFKIGVNDVKLKTGVIIDDIYTTGSTIDEISRTLINTFPCEIYFMTLTVGRGV